VVSMLARCLRFCLLHNGLRRVAWMYLALSMLACCLGSVCCIVTYRECCFVACREWPGGT